MLIYLVRHGQASIDDDGLYLPDAGLSNLGRQQARLVAAHLAVVEFDAAFTSNLARAIETAREFESLTGLGAQVIPDLAEIASGDIHSADPSVKTAIVSGEWDGGFEQFGGESICAFEERATRGFREMLRAAESKAADRVILFTHGGVSTAIIRLLGDGLTGTHEHVPNCAYAVLDTTAAGEPFPCHWMTAHLDGCGT